MFDETDEIEEEIETEEGAISEEGKSEEENDDTDETGDDETGEEKKTDEGKSGDEGDDDLIKDDDPKGVQKRINKVTKARRTAEREAAKLREENAYLKGLADRDDKEELKEEEPEVNVAPKEEDYEDMADYYRALGAFEGKKAAKEEIAAEKARDKADDAKTTKDTRKEKHRERVEAAMGVHEDYAEKVFVDDGSLPISEEMYENIVDSEKGAEVAYYLAEHPDEAQEIYDLDSPRAVSRAMGRIEDKVKVPIPQKSTGKSISKAPPPISPSKGGKSDPPGLRDDMPIDDWMKGRNDEVAAKEG